MNDNTVLDGTNTAANTILGPIPFGSLTVGQSFKLKFPCLNGIVLSEVPNGGSVNVSYN